MLNECSDNYTVIFRIQFLRDLRDFFGIVFKLDMVNSEDPNDEEQRLVLLTCLGIGYTNINRRVM